MDVNYSYVHCFVDNDNSGITVLWTFQFICLLIHIYLAVKIKFGKNENKFVFRVVIASLVNWVLMVLTVGVMSLIYTFDNSLSFKTVD